MNKRQKAINDFKDEFWKSFSVIAEPMIRFINKYILKSVI